MGVRVYLNSVVDSNSNTYFYEDADTWSRNDEGHLHVEDREAGRIVATFYNKDSYYLVEAVDSTEEADPE